ncbi:hypothetical protein VPH35_094769 [Triticum aestivum]
MYILRSIIFISISYELRSCCIHVRRNAAAAANRNSSGRRRSEPRPSHSAPHQGQLRGRLLQHALLRPPRRHPRGRRRPLRRLARPPPAPPALHPLLLLPLRPGGTGTGPGRLQRVGPQPQPPHRHLLRRRHARLPPLLRRAGGLRPGLPRRLVPAQHDHHLHRRRARRRRPNARRPRRVALLLRRAPRRAPPAAPGARLLRRPVQSRQCVPLGSAEDACQVRPARRRRRQPAPRIRGDILRQILVNSSHDSLQLVLTLVE